MMVAIAMALYAAPICTPLACNTLSKYVPMVTYQDPQIKKLRNIINESRTRVETFMP